VSAGPEDRGPRWAVTLFSFTNELLAGTETPDELLAGVLADGVADVIEIDAAQHFRSFPLLDPAEVRRTAEVVHAAGGSVSLLGGGADLTPAPGARLDDDAVLEQLATQLEAARLLGAEGVRIPFGVLRWPVLQRAADLARAAGVLLLEEVQGPADPGGPALQGRIADLDRTGEPAVRLLLDASALMAGLPPTYTDALRGEGVPADAVERLADAFGERRVAPEVLPHLADPALSPAAKSLLVTAMTRFGSRTAGEWLPLAPWIASVHLKWWDRDSAEADLAGETGALLEGLLEGGFAGTVCSEWGGHEWQGLDVPAAVESAAHRRLFEHRFRTFPTDFGTKTT
jgi:hypothetical protein